MFQFAGVGHGRRGAFAGDADGSGSSRGFDVFADVFSFCQFGGENSGKAVSGADGVDGRHFVTVDEQHVLAAGNQRAAAAERDDYGLFGVGFEFFGRVGDFFGRRVFIDVSRERNASSVSLTIKMSVLRNISSGIGQTGEGLRIVRAPYRRALAKAAATAAGGISN